MTRYLIKPLQRLLRAAPYSVIVGASLSLCLLLAWQFSHANAPKKTPWEDLTPFEMKGRLAVYWNVIERTGVAEERAKKLGFRPLTLLNTYSDYPGDQKENIDIAMGENPSDPWAKPTYFERIVRRNIELAPRTGVFVHDIEFQFEEDARTAWSNGKVRAASRASSFETFEEDYLREWSTWFSLPCIWVREVRPSDLCGIYGPQPFRRDYWGIAGRSAHQIDSAHERDGELWQYIDPYVDFVVSSVYIFYDRPDSVYYMAANIEANVKASREFGGRPVYAYEWLRFHDSNFFVGGKEVPSYLAEAMAIVPFFSGAEALVLWGFEPEWLIGPNSPYSRLAEYTSALARIAQLSERIGKGRLVIHEPAHWLWKERLPLVRRIDSAPGECIFMAVNPWQGDKEVSQAEVACSGTTFEISMNGRHVTLAEVVGDNVILY